MESLTKIFSVANVDGGEDYDLDDLGTQKVYASTHGPKGSHVIYTAITERDYDNHFANRLIYLNPVYHIPIFLDYHFEKYRSKHIEAIFLQYNMFLTNCDL